MALLLLFFPFFVVVSSFSTEQFRVITATSMFHNQTAVIFFLGFLSHTLNNNLTVNLMVAAEMNNYVIVYFIIAATS